MLRHCGAAMGVLLAWSGWEWSAGVRGFDLDVTRKAWWVGREGGQDVRGREEGRTSPCG